jgi:hypothetical protein
MSALSTSADTVTVVNRSTCKSKADIRTRPAVPAREFTAWMGVNRKRPQIPAGMSREKGSRDMLQALILRMSLSRNRYTLLLALTFGSGDMR